MTITRRTRARRPSKTLHPRIRTRSRTKNCALSSRNDGGCDGLLTEDGAVNVFICGSAAGEDDHMGWSLESGGVEESASKDQGRPGQFESGDAGRGEGERIVCGISAGAAGKTECGASDGSAV